MVYAAPYIYRGIPYRTSIPYQTMINKETIQAINNKTDIVEVIGDFVKLKKKGTQYVGLSPFNNERTPSFMVSPSKRIFKDFSSGKGGDVIEFLMQLMHIKYNEALIWLANKYKVDINETASFLYEPLKKEYAELPISYIDNSEFIPGDYNNPLFNYLSEKFGDGIIEDLFLKYNVTCFNDWIIFWLFDYYGKIRSAKYIKYKSDGHRDKDVSASWLHKRTKEYEPVYPDFNFVQCFFGEHLIKGNLKPIAIVESEKTALIASLFMDKYIWLACGSKYGLNDIKCKVLENRSVTLFPDLGAYNEWKIKAQQYGFNLSNHIENLATDTDRENGLDIADFLLR